MKQFRLINVTTGWLVFLIASIVYMLTIEPTASFWDCGEFITTSFKLEVGHPPGAPVFMILGRFFSLFASDNMQVAKMINIMSALSSSFTILFLYWTITHIARKIILKPGDLVETTDTTKAEFPMGKTIAIIGAGIVGSLAYTFSDTFWFSAVEGEVYAMSSLITAIVFWAMLKWENVAHEKHSNRWIILIAYLVGLSIGIHLLNLLAIPAMVFIYYFKKYKPSGKGVVAALGVSIVLLAMIMYGIVPGIVTIASKFELLFVNKLGMPFSSGVFVYVILLLGVIVSSLYFTIKSDNATLNGILATVSITLLGVPFLLGFNSAFSIFIGFIITGIVGAVFYYLAKNSKTALNTIILAATVIMIGYSSFAMIVIRSIAKTPMDQNSPDNVFSMLSYLNREQYGDRPLFKGQYFNAQVVDYVQGAPVYVKKNNKYEIIDHKLSYKYDDKFSTIFPRMYSDQNSPPHVKGYLRWAGMKEGDLYSPQYDEEGNPRTNRNGEIVYDRSYPTKSPSFGDNVEFFFKYQLGHMYLRYFMWNFAGRQNDIQGHGSILKGNWISGIPLIDNLRLGSQDKITDEMKNNKGKNKYYFLPLILGLIGLLWLYKKHYKYFWVTMLLFIFTGLAIVFYLNQPPYQPRERDYAYAASFYVFAIWIGLGVLSIYELLKKAIPSAASAGISAGICLILVPVIMGTENWDDHDRSNRYTASQFAHNYLESCAPNAILFTNGDNDTFPLWYAQEVEGFRTDVRVINLSYLSTDWYIDQMKRKAYDSDPIPFSLTHDQYVQGTRDIVRVHNEPTLFFAEKYNAAKDKLEPQYKEIFDKFMAMLSVSKFPEILTNDYKELQQKNVSMMPNRFAGLVSQVSKPENITKFGLIANEINSIKSATDKLIKNIYNQSLPVDIAMKFVANDDNSTKLERQSGDAYHFVPSDKLEIKVDKEKILKNGIVPQKYADRIVPSIKWSLNKTYLRKSELMVLDLIANNNWERPIYFAITVGPSNFMNLQEYFQIEGLAYRFVPVKATNFRLTDRSLNALSSVIKESNNSQIEEKDSTDILEILQTSENITPRLAAIKGISYPSEKELLNAVEAIVGSDTTNQYKDYIVAYARDTDGQTGSVSADIMYDNMMNKFQWGGIDNPDVYLDENNVRMSMNFRNNFSRLAAELLKRNEREKALKVLDKCIDLLPNEIIPYNYYNLLIAEQYYEASEDKKANDIVRIIANKTVGELGYFMSLDTKYQNVLDDEDSRAYAIMQEIVRLTQQYNQTELGKEIQDNFQALMMKN